MDTHYSLREYVELFHLLFMQQLGQKLDKRLYAVKGGCNLRFFLGSIRYSEDIDIDIHTVAVTTLKNMVDKILANPSFQQILKIQGIQIYQTSTLKQTAVTQRWKIQLQIAEQSLPINTKIEFSRRQATDKIVTESIPRHIIVQYKLRPIFMSHYTAPTALEQKIWALILRTETQARDVFDIYQLLQMYDLTCPNLFSETELETAKQNLSSVSFADFKAQVLAYLMPSDQANYDNAQLWDEIVLFVSHIFKRPK